MVDAVVGDAEGADLAGGLGFDEGAPGAETAVAAAVGGVDEVAGEYVSFAAGLRVHGWGFSGAKREVWLGMGVRAGQYNRGLFL